MKKNGILTLLFAFIPGAGQMYQGYMKRGLSLVLMAAAIGMAAMLIPPIAFALLVVFMYSFFDTFNLRAQISMGTAPEDDYLVHFDPQDKRLARMMMDSHKLLGWGLIALGGLVAYENVIMRVFGDVMWRWGQNNPVFRAFYLMLDELPQIVTCVALIVCGLWLGRGIRCPMTALYIPALLPMVPGIYAYKTVFSLIMFLQSLNDPGEGLQYMQQFFLNATVSLSVIALLAAGATLPIFVFNHQAFSLTRRRKHTDK